MRCFISVELPDEAKEKVVRIQEMLKKGSFFERKMTEKENLHLTLKFLGEVKDAGKVKELLRQVKGKCFTAVVDEFGVFSKGHIVWMKAEGAEELQKQVDDALSGMFEKENRFMGHVTIARPKKFEGSLLNFLGMLKKEKFSFDVKSFFFMKSELKEEGPVYTKLEEYHLV